MLVGACSSTSSHAAPSHPVALSYVPWLPLPAGHEFVSAPDPSPTPPTPIHPGVPACKAVQLEAVELGQNGAGGHTSTPIALRNRSSAACFLDGFPDLRLFNSGGRQLAAATGSVNRGTFFDAGPEWTFPVLMQPGTPPLPVPPAVEQPLSPGQGLLDVEWFDCNEPQASRAQIDLPAGGGRLNVTFAIKGPGSGLCFPGGPAMSGLLRGPFFPAGIEWPPGPTYLPVIIDISAPASAKPGSTLDYFITMTNTGVVDYVLAPCPDYGEFLGAKEGAATNQLNCGPVGHIAAGAGVKFEMRLQVPASTQVGTTQLNWSLLDGRIGTPFAHTTIDIT
jgi:hypothetical protein